MPPSERKMLRSDLNGLLFEIVMLNEVEGGGREQEIDEILALLGGVDSCRYLNPRVHPTRSPVTLHRFEKLSDSAYMQTLRVTRSTFAFLLQLIGSDRVFKNNSPNKQRAVAIQLAVTLEWYGAHGNGNAVGRIARDYGIGNGTLSTYVRRVQKALLRHYSRYVKWPSRTQRLESSVFHNARYGLGGVVGMVDGTHVIFDQKPAVNGGIHYNRKSRYSFNVQVVCNEDKRILFIYTGWPGSCNDSSIFAKTPIMQQPQLYFSGDEYLLGDSGYGISNRLIVPYKNPAAARDDNKLFNEALCSARVKNENCIGLLKNRWMSLKGIRTQLNALKDFRHVNNHIFACALLHNIAIDLNDPWEDDSRDADDHDVEPEGQGETTDSQDGKLKRERLKRLLLTANE